MEYFIAAGQQRMGPFTVEQLAGQNLRPDALVWREGMAQWTPASAVPELSGLFQPLDPSAPATPYNAPTSIGYAQPGSRVVPPFVPGQSNRTLAGMLGIFLGAFGIHKFVIGLNNSAIVMLSITIESLFVGYICCFFIFAPIVMTIIGCIEGIMYLCCTDEEFYMKYIVQQRQWF